MICRPPSWAGVSSVVDAGGWKGALLYFRAVRHAALAARVAPVRISSSWPDDVGGLPWTAPHGGTATQTATSARVT
jgi:hypothetical protein